MAYICRIMIVLIAASGTVLSAPSKKPQMGPCIGMDCLHGVLMHGDSNGGNDHVTEDEKAKEESDNKFKGQQTGPCEGLDCMHGVLMHGDKSQGDDHKTEDEDRKKNIEEENKKTSGPCVGMDCLHGVMMHGDTKQDQDHQTEHAQTDDKEKKMAAGTPGVENPDDLMHGGSSDEHSKESAENKQNKPKYEAVSSNLNPEEFMHGSSDHGKDIHQRPKKPNDPVPVQKMAPDLEAVLHGSPDGHVHDGKPKPKETPKQPIDTSVDPESMLHGPGESHDHPKNPKRRPKNGIPSVAGPEEMIHGPKGHVDENLRYKQREKSTSWNFLSGWSFPFISDSIISNVEQLKKRYLPKFWGNDEKEDDKATPGDDTIAASTTIDPSDMRHELESIGSTAQIKHIPRKESKRKGHNKHDES